MSYKTEMTKTELTMHIKTLMDRLKGANDVISMLHVQVSRLKANGDEKQIEINKMRQAKWETRRLAEDLPPQDCSTL
jgi:predicted RNase H-like nuclease (RuvC/YqgF family)|tara:strand:- start:312 stop:542 length:231 start_codon:yes stop_codon:yes gene_type:complete